MNEVPRTSELGSTPRPGVVRRKYCWVSARTAKRGQVSNFAVFLRNSLPVPGLPLADHTPFNLRRTTIVLLCYKQQFDVELFCGITPFFARPTTEALRGIYRGPGQRRGTRRPAHTVEELLHGIVVARRTQECRADGCALGSQQRWSHAPVTPPFGGRRAVE